MGKDLSPKKRNTAPMPYGSSIPPSQGYMHLTPKSRAAAALSVPKLRIWHVATEPLGQGIVSLLEDERTPQKPSVSEFFEPLELATRN